MTDLDPEEAGRRVRAMWAYSRKEQRDIARDAGVHFDALRKLLSRSTAPPRAPSIEVLWQIADVCGVPRWFAEYGWEHPVQTPANGSDGLDDRVRRLEAQVASLLAAAQRPSAGGSAATDQAP